MSSRKLLAYTTYFNLKLLERFPDLFLIIQGKTIAVHASEKYF